MEYSYQKAAQWKRDSFVFIPENTTIKKECLVGIDNETFVRCFRNLQEMGRNVYDDMITNFADYGIKAETGKDGHYNLVSCFGDVLYQIALLGKLDNGSLTVNIENFKAGSKKHKFNMIINKLRDNGFDITNHNGKTFVKGAETFDVSYPDMPEILNVLKGYALLVAKYMDDITPSMRLYKTDAYNFLNFQYRFVEDETTREFPEPTFMIMTDRLSDDCKKAMYWWYKEAVKHGYELESGFSDVIFKKGSKNFLSINADGGKINSRIILRKVINKHMDMLYALPEYLQESFKKSTCSLCAGNKATNEKCTMVIRFEWNGKKMIGCAYHSFKFNDIKFEDLPLILDLYKTEFNLH